MQQVPSSPQPTYAHLICPRWAAPQSPPLAAARLASCCQPRHRHVLLARRRRGGADWAAWEPTLAHRRRPHRHSSPPPQLMLLGHHLVPARHLPGGHLTLPCRQRPTLPHQPSHPAWHSVRPLCQPGAPPALLTGPHPRQQDQQRSPAPSPRAPSRCPRYCQLPAPRMLPQRVGSPGACCGAAAHRGPCRQVKGEGPPVGWKRVQAGAQGAAWPLLLLPLPLVPPVQAR